MASINTPIQTILQFHDKIKEIFTRSLHEFREVRLTRSAVSKSDPSCRMWQLFLCLLNVLERKKPGTIFNLISIANKSNQLYPFQRDFTKLIQSISNDRTSLLHHLFIQTQITENVKKIESIDELQQGFNYLGICVLHPTNSRYDVISHYFTIIRMENQFFIESAYGSEYIHTPPYFAEVSPDEIQMLITSLRVLHEAGNDVKLNEGPMRFITYFYNTYFFKGNQMKYPNKEMRETLGKNAKRFQPISNPENRELHTVFGSKNINAYVGLIQDYEEILDDYLTTLKLNFYSSPQHGSARKKQTIKNQKGSMKGEKYRYKPITHKKKHRYF